MKRSQVRLPVVMWLSNNSRQVAHLSLFIALSSIILYQCKAREGDSGLWKRCGLPFMRLEVSSLLAHDHSNREAHCVRAVCATLLTFYFLHFA